MLITVGLTMIWMFYIEPKTYFYAYFDTRPYNIWWFLGSVLAYMFWFDTWFFWSHRWLHDFDILWNKVHYIHHQFKEPSCFAQFSVHPVEAALQGPVGHYMATLFFPFHPVALAVFGFLSSAWAIAAHDGRAGDFNSHYYHHSKGRGRHIYFNLGFLTPFWDWYCGTRWHEDHPQWVQWKERRGKVVFDTRDGTKEGQPNDAYGAYNFSLTAVGSQEGEKKSN
uniref:Fatty acid hydroxylase domain-containing protein n=1 Tax=Arcella intermedia TaxID=1963864 RepID=A0A6B2LGA4_9EUKA